MKCFVIMPFSAEFDDVYNAIKQSVRIAAGDKSCQCFRLDELRPAGRITERLIQELHSASFCIADVTGLRPNVMWEVGYVMALGKPTILVAQQAKDLPFDLKDLQYVAYDRSRLAASLERPLGKVVTDTIALAEGNASSGHDPQEMARHMISEVASLKQMVAAAVSLKTNDAAGLEEPVPSLKIFEGSWINSDSGTHLYAKIIKGDLIAPYCFEGNDRLHSVYFDWRYTGTHWFARYKWFSRGISGFCFLQQQSADLMTGAWWGSDSALESLDRPPKKAGIAVEWERTNKPAPKWAIELWERVQKKGIKTVLGLS